MADDPAVKGWTEEELTIRRGNYLAFLEESGYNEPQIMHALQSFDAKEKEMNEKENMQ